jgi:hypothetical protein
MHTININKLDRKYNEYDIIKSLVKDSYLDVRFLYESDYRNTKYLRDFVEAICTEFNFNSRLLAKIVLVTDELNNNAIEY